MKSTSLENELGYFEVKLPVVAEEFRERVKRRIKSTSFISSGDLFNTPSTIDYHSIHVRDDKIVVHKERRMFTSNDSIGTGTIEITIENKAEFSIAKGKIWVQNQLPLSLFIGIPFIGMGLYVALEFELLIGFVFAFLGLALPVYSILIQRDYYLNLRKYAMNFIKDIMKES